MQLEPNGNLNMGIVGYGGHYGGSDYQWHNGSSRKLKTNIKPNDFNVFEILDKVNIVNYQYKAEYAENPNSMFHIGFIAEDTPKLLSGQNQSSMATGDCIGLLLAIVKEQQANIEALEKRIAYLESD